MIGYRTIIFGFAVTLLGMIGQHVAPETLNHWLDFIFAVIGLGIVALRMATTTPVFNRVAAEVGLSDSDIASLKSEILSSPLDAGVGLGAAFSDLSGKLDALISPPDSATDDADPAPAAPQSPPPAPLAPAAALPSTPPVVPITAVLVALFLSVPLWLTACTSQQVDETSAALGLAEAVSPAVSADVAIACVKYAPKVQAVAADAAVASSGAQPTATAIKTLVTDSCTLEGQKQLTANDAAPVTATNSGNSSGWLSDLATAAQVIQAVAPIALAL